MLFYIVRLAFRMLFYIVRLAFRMQFYIVRLANSQCVVSRIRRQVNHW